MIYRTIGFAISILLGAGLARAGTSTSADYAVTTAVLDAGGAKTTSAAYGNDGSIGAIGSVAIIDAYQSRGGFPGQLYELTNALQVNLSPASISEGESRQLSVQAVANDATRVNLAPSMVAWSSTGEVSINATGSATGGAVYQDTPATAFAAFGSASGQLALTILDTQPDNFGLYAGDEIDDTWQIGFFGVDHPDGVATADADGDGQDNRLEFLAETSPDNGDSRLRLRLETVPGHPGWKTLVFSPFSTQRSYAVEWTELFDQWQPLASFSEDDIGNEHYVIDKDAQDPRRFYRLKINR